jgi:membrane protein
LGIAGLLIFAVTSILLLDSISETFNAVWGSSNRRNFIAKFTSYSSVIVFGTLFIGASFAITNPLHDTLLKFPGELFIIRWFLQLLPSLFIFSTFLLMISAIPAGKVNLKSALIGALCGTVLWDLSRWIFVNSTNYVIKMSIIYGSLAAVPIFLLWLYIIWVIVLGSLEITYVHQYLKGGSLKIMGGKNTPINQILTGIALIISIGMNFKRGKNPYSLAKLAYVNALSVNECMEYIGSFTNHGILYISPDKKRILPLKDFHALSAKTVLEALIGTAEQPVEIAESFLAAGYASIEKITVSDLLQR